MTATKTLVQDIAKRMVREPAEILEEASRQMLGGEVKSEPSAETTPQPPDSGHLAAQDERKSGRLLEALNRELVDISRDKLLKQLQGKIASGEIVYLEQYPQLSPEQKQVLQAQIEAMKARQDQQLASQKPLVEPGPRKGRRLFDFGQKTNVERQKTHVERPLPPSG